MSLIFLSLIGISTGTSSVPTLSGIHDSTCFTQGIFREGSNVYESCGRYHQSSVRKYGFTENGLGEPLLTSQLEDQYFAEGITSYNSTHMVLMTWKERVFLLVDKETLNVTRFQEFPDEIQEGWGIAKTCNSTFYMTDGSDKLRELNSEFGVIWSKSITDCSGRTVPRNLNSLTYIHPFLFVNIWQTKTILMIDPLTAQCLHEISTEPMDEWSGTGSENTANGVFQDTNEERFIIHYTGKLWKNTYRVELSDRCYGGLKRHPCGSDPPECSPVRLLNTDDKLVFVVPVICLVSLILVVLYSCVMALCKRQTVKYGSIPPTTTSIEITSDIHPPVLEFITP